MIVSATYSSVFDDSLRLSSPCKFDTASKRVFEIEPAAGEDAAGADALTDEYVTLPGGDQLHAEDGAFFDY